MGLVYGCSCGQTKTPQHCACGVLCIDQLERKAVADKEGSANYSNDHMGWVITLQTAHTPTRREMREGLKSFSSLYVYSTTIHGVCQLIFAD